MEPLTLKNNNIEESLKVPTMGIVVDAEVSGNPGLGSYRGMDLATGEILFQSKKMYLTNNLCEFLALVHGLMYCQKNRKHNRVFSDSVTAISWVIIQ